MTTETGLHRKEKICSVCKGKPQPIANFQVSSRGTGYRGECKKCRNRLRRERRWSPGNAENCKTAKQNYQQSDRGKLKTREWKLRTKYGLTLDQFDEIMRRQQGRCKICKVYFKKEKKVKVHVDHNHETGQVRGLLCSRCNAAIGLLDENVSNLRRAIRYLNKGKALLG